MSNLTLTKPVKFGWVVYIVGKDGLLTSEAEYGNSPEEATEKGKAKINDMLRKEEL